MCYIIYWTDAEMVNQYGLNVFVARGHAGHPALNKWSVMSAVGWQQMRLPETECQFCSCHTVDCSF